MAYLSLCFSVSETNFSAFSIILVFNQSSSFNLFYVGGWEPAVRQKFCYLKPFNCDGQRVNPGKPGEDAQVRTNWRSKVKEHLANEDSPENVFLK